MGYSLYKVGEVVCGYYRDEQKLLASASGGICTALAETIIIQKKGVVFGAVYSKDFSQVEYAVAKTVQELSPMRGSKYVATKKVVFFEGKYVPVFEIVIKYLKNNTPVLFVGLGCDVAALLKKCSIENVDISNLYAVDLICHGTTLDKVHTDFINGLKRRFRSEIKSFNLRYKERGWMPPFVRVEFSNGKVYEKCFSETDYGKAFAKVARNGCYKCIFKGENHKADLTVGDYWGITEGMPVYNKNGVSICFINSEKGKGLLDIMEESRFFISQADRELAISHNPMYMRNRKKDPKYEQFCDDLKKINLMYAVLHEEGFLRGIYWRIKNRPRIY